MKVLIMTGKFGMGHWSAANALRDSMCRAVPGLEVSVVDLFDWAAPGCAGAIYTAFSLLVNHGSSLYNIYYKATGLARSGSGNGSLCTLALMEKVEELIDAEKPDCIVSTHPLCAQLISYYKKERLSALPLVTCITDMSVHPEWINPRTDCYLVGSSEVREGLIERGVDESRVVIAGIPVRPEFKLPPLRTPHEGRELLLMGGGLGMLPRGRKFYDGLDRMPGVHTTIITGNNQKLYNKLAGRWENITVLGFTGRVRDYMLQADLMLSKPGGITLSEAICSGLPILMPKPFLQQERNNAAFAVRRGIGRVAPKGGEECLDVIQNLLFDGNALESMSGNMARLRAELEENGLEERLARLAQNAKGRCA